MSCYDIETDKLICMICGFKSNQLGRHISDSHKILRNEYFAKFPGAKTSRLTIAQIEKMRATKNAKDSKHKIHLREKEDRKLSLLNSGKDLIRCNLCEFTSMMSIISHITRKHAITIVEYRTKFQNAIVQRMCDSQREKMNSTWKSEDRIQKLLVNRSYPSEIKHWIKKGFSLEDSQLKVREYQINNSLKQNNESTKLIQSEKTTGGNNPMSLQRISARHNVSLLDAMKLTPCYMRRGNKHPMFGKNHSDEARKRIASNCSKTFYSRSKGEEELAKFLSKNAYSITRNKGISFYNCDIVFNNLPLIVEYFGDFWHCNPRFWSDQKFNSRIKMTAKEKWDKDAYKLKMLEAEGYNVIVVWEYDWKHNPEKIVKEIADVANRIS